MVDKYQVADAFVIDVCIANDQLQIVEINNINSAGFYDCNMFKLIEALENFYN
jgi:ATP-grasp domain, R2K clade family 3